MKTERVSRTQSVVNGLLDEIIAGRLAAGETLPAEADLAALLGVSRLTLREGVRLLQAQGVIVPVPGSRHRVAPVDEWTGLEAVVRYSRSGGARRRSSLDLIDMRVMFETGAAELAAPKCTPEHIAQLEVELAKMRSAHTDGDVPGFVQADLAFHDVIFAAADNRILVASVRPLTTMLQDSRGETSSVREIRDHAIDEHAAVLAAMRTGAADAAREAMASHMRQTRNDLLHYVLGE